MWVLTTGVSGDLAVIMTSFVPEVECSNDVAPPLQHCELIVDRMSTSGKPLTFGKVDKKHLHPDVRLPKYLYDSKFAQSSCEKG